MNILIKYIKWLLFPFYIIKSYLSYVWMKIPSMKKFEDLKNRINELIALSNIPESKLRIDSKEIDEFTEFRNSSLSFIEKLYGKEHTYYKGFVECFRIRFQHPDDIVKARGVLKAIKGEIDGGWLFEIKSLVTAEVFADFLTMAEYLLGEGYKDASAIMIGGSLEGHLKQLCMSNNIPVERTNTEEKIIPIKAETLNVELTKKNIYNGTVQKQITAWLGLRNDAAHAHYDKYTPEQVKNMYDGVLSFIALNPA